MKQALTMDKRAAPVEGDGWAFSAVYAPDYFVRNIRVLNSDALYDYMMLPQPTTDNPIRTEETTTIL